MMFAVVLGHSVVAQPRTEPASMTALDQALAAGQLKSVRQALNQMLEPPHLELGVILEAGARLAQYELFDSARTVFARGVSEYPLSFEARYNLALADFALRKFSEAQTALDGADSLSNEQRLARDYLRGKLYDGLGQTDLAERSLAAAFHGAPLQENYALDLGLHYLRRGLYPKALETLRAGVKHCPDSIYLELGLALAEVLGDNPLKATATCRRILAKEPNLGPARLLLLVGSYLNGEYQECAAETESVLRQPDAPPYLYYLHAASLLKLNSKAYAVMLHDLNQASNGIPNCAFCYLMQSKVHQAMDDNAAAIVDLETLVTRLDPEFSQGWYRLGKLYERSGRQEDASKALQRFQSIKSQQGAREMEYLRKLFLSALGSEQTAR